MDDKLIVEQNILGNILYIMCAFTISALCVVLVFVDFRSMGSTLAAASMKDILIGYITKEVILVIGVIFFAYVAFILIKRAKRKAVILQADMNGITDNSSGISLGYIPWTDVKRIYLDQILGNKFIELELYEADKYLSRIGSLKRKTIEMNLKMGHQAVCITLNSTGKNTQEIYSKLQRLYFQSKEYKENWRRIKVYNR